MTRRNAVLAGALVTGIAGLWAGQAALEAAAMDQQVRAPVFEVDPFWPKPLPNGWVIGMTIGLGIDARDHVYVVHRQNTVNAQRDGGASADPPISECCSAAPPVLEFDPEGNLVNSWGGPGEGFTWPTSNHGIAIDHKDNIWIGGNGAGDSHVLKFTRDGRLLMQIGTPGQPTNSQSLTSFGRVAKIAFDVNANEAYFADGYSNRRVAVVDMDNGQVKRFWGAYGNAPDDTPTPGYDPDAPLIQQFRTPVHCAEPSSDGLVYVCDRPNDRIQVFRTDGTFVREVRIAPRTLGDGSVWDIAFSRDPEQTHLYLADGKNERIYVIRRNTLEILTEFGSGGRQPGQFFGVHSIATDSRGNLFTTETYEGRRLQKFVYKGMGMVARKQGVVWPGR
jgi:DNA-binding beta-propeller fold protein YncE